MASDAYSEFVMGFVSASDKYRSQFTDKWQEIMANFVVSIDDVSPIVGRRTTPYSRTTQPVYRDLKQQVLLKDPETHKAVMTFVAKLTRALFGDNHHEYLRCRPIGYEDAHKADTVTRLLRYCFSRPGHFRTFVETLVDMCIFGTAIIESPWRYEEKEVLARQLSMGYDGQMDDTFHRMTVPAYDDVCLRNVDPMDFYPDPSRYRISEMSGCAKRFRLNLQEAKLNANYDQEAVERAFQQGSGIATGQAESFRKGLDQPSDSTVPPKVKECMAYEYWGDIPPDLKLRDENDRQITSGRGVITIINNVCVRSDAWPLADYYLPFHTFIINPMNGRFYGLAPAEIVRWDQSFADAMKVLLAKAVIRQVHPPIAYDSDADFDPVKLREWKADLPIPIRGGPQSIGTLRYDANVQNGMSLLGALKVGIQEGTGALGAIQGESGPDRESASVGVQRMQFAMDRPELAAMVIENECLPPLGSAILRRYQQFLSSDEDLKLRVGELPEPVWLGDIMGDFDVEFSGSRLTMNRQQKLQAWDRVIAMAQAVPAFQMVLPSMKLAKSVLGDLLEMPDVANEVGTDPAQMQANMAAMQQFGAGGAGANGVPQASEPAGMLPAQAAG